MPGFVSESERHRYTRQAKWMVTPPTQMKILDLPLWKLGPSEFPASQPETAVLWKPQAKNALLCEPGCIKSLAKRLEEAVNMSEEEYEKKSLLAKKDLEDYVRPLDQYAEQYLQLLEQKLMKE